MALAEAPVLILESWVVPSAYPIEGLDSATHSAFIQGGNSTLVLPADNPLTTSMPSGAIRQVLFDNNDAVAHGISTVLKVFGTFFEGSFDGSLTRQSDVATRARFSLRPHQSITIVVFNASALRLSVPAAAKTPAGVPPVHMSYHAPAAVSRRMAALPNVTLMANLWDGEPVEPLCKVLALDEPWPSSFSGDPAGYAPSSTMCFGGHGSSCDVSTQACAGLGIVTLADAQAPPGAVPFAQPLVGSTCGKPPCFDPGARPSWQVGYTTMLAWFRPCQSCRAGSCDVEACRRNITRHVQARAVRPGVLPPPASLSDLVSADGGAFAIYDCWPSAATSFLRGWPVCAGVCGQEQVAWTTSPRGPGRDGGGMLSARSWLMGWSGDAAATAPSPGSGSASPSCEAVCRVLERAVLPALEEGAGAPGGRAGRLTPSACGLLSSAATSGASVLLTLLLPSEETRSVSRVVFLAEVAAEAEAVAGGTAASCVSTTCESCPSEDDGAVWSVPGGPAWTGREWGLPSAAVRLGVRVSFASSASAGCGAKLVPSSSSADLAPEPVAWLVDARVGEGAGSDDDVAPVAFTGGGSNTTWSSARPWLRGAASGAAWERVLGPRNAPLLQAASLRSAIGTARVVGRWMVWLNGTSRVRGLVHCLGAEAESGLGPGLRALRLGRSRAGGALDVVSCPSPGRALSGIWAWGSAMSSLAVVCLAVLVVSSSGRLRSAVCRRDAGWRSQRRSREESGPEAAARGGSGVVPGTAGRGRAEVAAPARSDGDDASAEVVAAGLGACRLVRLAGLVCVVGALLALGGVSLGLAAAGLASAVGLLTAQCLCAWRRWRAAWLARGGVRAMASLPSDSALLGIPLLGGGGVEGDADSAWTTSSASSQRGAVRDARRLRRAGPNDAIVGVTSGIGEPGVWAVTSGGSDPALPPDALGSSGAAGLGRTSTVRALTRQRQRPSDVPSAWSDAIAGVLCAMGGALSGPNGPNLPVAGSSELVSRGGGAPSEVGLRWPESRAARTAAEVGPIDGPDPQHGVPRRFAPRHGGLTPEPSLSDDEPVEEESLPAGAQGWSGEPQEPAPPVAVRFAAAPTAGRLWALPARRQQPSDDGVGPGDDGGQRPAVQGPRWHALGLASDVICAVCAVSSLCLLCLPSAAPVVAGHWGSELARASGVAGTAGPAVLLAGQSQALGMAAMPLGVAVVGSACGVVMELAILCRRCARCVE